MLYLHLPHQRQNPNSFQNLIYKDSKFIFQHVMQIDDAKVELFNIQLDASNFTGAVRKMLFPGQPNSYVAEDARSCGRPTMAEHYIIDTSTPKRQDLPDEEVLVNLWIQSDGLEIMIYIGEDDGINYVMDEAVMKDVQMFINGIVEDMKRQMMLLTSNVTATMACVEQTAGMPFQCCGQCEVCHCAE